jgi:hypothetical protein
MEAISAAEIVRLWERGAGVPAVERMLSLLDVFQAGRTQENLAALSIGERDGRLLALREALFGPTLNSVTECPNCEVGVEFSLDAKKLREQAPPEAAIPQRLTVGDITLQFRLLDSDDLAAVAGYPDANSARRCLAERCVLGAAQGNTRMNAANLPDVVVQELSRLLARIDSRADLTLELRCPECKESWTASFDIASFLWSEVSARAKQLLGEVHALAWAYGWNEADILAMSDARRRFYLTMVQ